MNAHSVASMFLTVYNGSGSLSTGFCREFQTLYSTIHVERQISLQESEVSAPLKTVIYRVIQKALNNIAKHSRADRVHLSLSKLDGKIELAIKDNGVGFVLEDALSIESARRGFGLSGMRERVELSGGAFSIESQKGSGTTVQALWSASKRAFVTSSRSVRSPFLSNNDPRNSYEPGRAVMF